MTNSNTKGSSSGKSGSFLQVNYSERVYQDPPLVLKIHRDDPEHPILKLSADVTLADSTNMSKLRKGSNNLLVLHKLIILINFE